LLDRQVLSLAAPVLRAQFGLSNTDYGAIVFLFLLGMTLGQIPAGKMIDRIGARAGLSLIVAAWSAASGLHALARSVAQFGGLRLLLGLSECGLYSGGIKVVSEWFPVEERALAGGLFNSGSLAGAVVAPPLLVFVMLRYGWPAAFLLPAALGVLWVFPWLLVYRRRVVHAPDTRPVPVRALLCLAPAWGVILMRAFGGPVTHFYWYWLPEYLKYARGMSLAAIGAVAWLPYLSGGLGNIVGGWFSSALLRRGWSVDRARKAAVCASVALCLAAILVPAVSTAASAIALISVATFGINSLAATLIGLLTDIFPERVLAQVTGITGVGDGAMGMLTMLATGIVVDRFSYYPVFLAAGALPLLSLAAFLALVREVKPIQVIEC
ncbi:MAG: MFS transporter, partial [Bryobacteraceae bacterium]